MKKSLIILIVAALCLALSLGVVAFAANAGSADDPIITKSYLDSVIADLKKSSGGSGSGGEYIVLEGLSTGTVVVGGASAEMILRTGSAKAYIPSTAGGGLSDLTSGSNIANGKKISANHLLLFPRNDGRGLQVLENNTYIMVKGDYLIQ